MGIPQSERLFYSEGHRHLDVLRIFFVHQVPARLRRLRDDGREAETRFVDVTNFDSVQKFLSAAATAGHIDAVVHAAGLSPAIAPAKRILEVDFFGTARHRSARRLAISRASAHLATAPRDMLLTIKDLLNIDTIDPAPSPSAPTISVCRLRRGRGRPEERASTISPGVILTATVRQELEPPHEATIQAMIKSMPMRRGGGVRDCQRGGVPRRGQMSRTLRGGISW
ncbi:hypothetical protein VTI74DRAFT_5020 [Chaetomium olivicolor]